jgi:hypothetical protein
MSAIPSRCPRKRGPRSIGSTAPGLAPAGGFPSRAPASHPQRSETPMRLCARRRRCSSPRARSCQVVRPAWCERQSVSCVIASVAKQSSAGYTLPAGLLRYTRNDRGQVEVATASARMRSSRGKSTAIVSSCTRLRRDHATRWRSYWRNVTGSSAAPSRIGTGPPGARSDAN